MLNLLRRNSGDHKALVLAGTIGLILFIGRRGAAQGRGNAPVSDVRVSASNYSREANKLSINIVNDSPSVVTAWSYLVKAGDEPDVRVSKDYYETTGFADLDARIDRTLKPQETRTEIIDYRVSSPSAPITAVIDTVVFENKTSVGDRQVVDAIFSARRNDADALALYLPRLQSLLTSGAAPQSLADFAASLQPEAKGTPALASRLKTDLDKIAASAPGTSLAAPLQKLIDVYQRQYQAAIRHSR